MAKAKELNINQRKFLSDFLNGLSIAWFSAGVIAPLFTGFDNLLKLILQVTGSVGISFGLVFVGIRNLKGR